MNGQSYSLSVQCFNVLFQIPPPFQTVFQINESVAVFTATLFSLGELCEKIGFGFVRLFFVLINILRCKMKIFSILLILTEKTNDTVLTFFCF